MRLQVHISVVGKDKMRISWITDSPTAAKVQYATSPDANGPFTDGTTSSYRYLLYKSGEIHDVVIGPLKPNTLYYYRLGDSPQLYNFTTPPSQFPIKFAVVGNSIISLIKTAFISHHIYILRIQSLLRI